MRTFFMFLGLCCLFASAPAGAAEAAAQPKETPKKEAVSPAATPTSAPLSELAAWEGKGPFEKIKGTSLWREPGFKAALTRALGKDRMDILYKEWMGSKEEGGLQGQILRRGDVLGFGVCKQHACSTDTTTIYVNMPKGRVEVCWLAMSSVPQDGINYWLSSDAPARKLDTADCLGGDGFQFYDLFSQDAKK